MAQELYIKFPCRETEIHQLYQLYGQPEEPFLDSVYIYGVSSTGKTTIVTKCLKNFGVKYIMVDLIRCNTTKIFLETILQKINDLLSLKRTEVELKCDNLMDFMLKIQRMSLEQLVIVIDKAERFRNMDVNLLPAFLRLRELTRLNITSICISTLEFAKIIHKSHLSVPYELHFRQYSREEILKILLLNCPEDQYLDFYKNYLNVLLSVFYKNCRDLPELRHQAQQNYSKYCQPITDGSIKKNDVSKLWHNIAPTLKLSLESVYMRTTNTEVSKSSTLLPFYAKYLLIAAYLASYNPAKEDKRLFTKDHGKKRKTKTQAKSGNKVSELLNTQLGPKQFTFDRLLAIFFSIVSERVGLCSNLMSQISSLVQMQMLTSVGEEVNLDGQKFKCNVNFECIQNICKSVGFNIRKYLFDFI